MEKTIRCPECGDSITPEFGTCPVCSYSFRQIDYMQQGMKEEDFTGVTEIKMSPTRFFGYLKVIAFVIVLFLIVIKFFGR